ncbi:helicase associated domain-containing protein [Streptacidiphilus sp. PAMC 29251]
MTAPTQSAVPAAAPARSQTDRFNTGLAAATAWAAQHGGTITAVKRSDVQPMPDGPFKLGLWVGNVRQRAVKLTKEQRAALDTLGMRW